MTDLDEAAEKLATKATLRAAENAARKALDDAFLSDEERAERKAKEASAAKRKRQKTLAIAVVALLLVLGVVGLVINYWQWFLLAGLIGLGALYGRHRWRQQRGRQKVATESVPKELVARRRVESPAASAEESAREIEDELAELKARVKR